MKGFSRFRIILLVFVIPFYNIAFAEENSIERIVADLKINKDGAVSPDFFVPYYWTPQFYSGIGYHNWEEGNRDGVDGYAESRLSENNNFSKWRLTLLSWQSLPGRFMYSLGVEMHYIEVDKQEFGYIHFPADLGGEWVAFDNDVGVNVTKPGLVGSIKWTNTANSLVLKAEGLVTPKSLLSVNQETEFKPIVSSTGSSKDRELQDFSWELHTDVIFKTTRFADLGLSLSYELLPLNYSLATLDYDTDTSVFSFSKSNIEVEQATLSWDIKFYLKYKLIGDAKPVFGFGQRKVTNKDTVSDESESSTENLFSIGFGQLF